MSRKHHATGGTRNGIAAHGVDVARQLLARGFGALVVVLLVTLVAFLLSYLSPSDAAVRSFAAAGISPTETQLAERRAELGLDRPFFDQYAAWLTGVLRGDLGTSLRTGKPVAEVLGDAAPYTLALALSSILLALLVSVPLGLACAWRHGGPLDRAVRAVTCLFNATPPFFVALLLLYVFSVRLRAIDVISTRGLEGILLPTVATALPLSAWLTRQVRAAALGQLSAPYVEGLRARGIPELRIVSVHGLKNILAPLLTLAGTSFGMLLGGSAIVESIFGWPGLGLEAVKAVAHRDYPLIAAYALVTAVAYLLVNGAVDGACRRIGPAQVSRPEASGDKGRKMFLVVLSLTCTFVALLVVAPAFLPGDVGVTDLGESLRAPGEGHPLGTDSVGRDVLMRTVAGGRESVVLALGTVALVAAVGVTVGLVGGCLGGPWDYALNKVVTAFQAFPGFVLAVAVAGTLGPGAANAVLAVGAVYWTQFARLTRAAAVSFRQSDRMRAARMCGAPTASIVFRYLLPEVAGPVAAMAALSVSDVVLTMAGLSFIGLGPERPTNEWGAMMAEAQPTFQYALWCMLVPMAALLLTAVLFNLLGDTLREALDGRTEPMGRRKKATRVSAAVLVAVLAAALLAGCSGSDGGSGPDPSGGPGEKVLHAGSTTHFSAESMDPASGWDSWYLSYFGIVENLFRVGDDLTPEPWLAKGVERVDDRTWRVTLNDGIEFSNGGAVDAAAVKAAWERTFEKNPRGAETLPCEELVAEGNTLTIRTREPLPSLEHLLCDPILCVYYVGDGVDYAAGTSGTGPYVKKEFEPEDHVVVGPNERYWRGTPKLSEVRLTCFSNDNAVTMAMQNGEIDAVAMPSASTLAILAQEGGDYRVSRRTTSRADFICMNMTHPLVQNDAVRTAVSHCIDRDGYADVVCQGNATPSWGVYSGTLPFGGTEGLRVDVDRCDVAAAARVLEEAGITDTDGDGVREVDGAPVELDLYTCTSYERFVRIADDLQSKLAQAGIRLRIVPTDYFLEDKETWAQDDPDMTLDSSAMAPTGDAAYFATIHFVTGASANFGGYSNREVDGLVQRLNQTFDEEERDGIARRIAQVVLDEKPYIFFSNPDATVVSSPAVSGLDVAPSEYYFLTVDTDVA